MNIIQFASLCDLLTSLDYLWNRAIELKKKNRTLWIYVDGIDEMIYSSVCSDYLVGILERSQILKVPITIVIQNSVNIVTNQKANIEFDCLLEKIQFFRLFSLGPVERKRFLERLNISQQLIPYIVDREPGEGVFLTPSVNVPVNDLFDENVFFQLFR